MSYPELEGFAVVQRIWLLIDLTENGEDECLHKLYVAEFQSRLEQHRSDAENYPKYD